MEAIRAITGLFTALALSGCLYTPLVEVSAERPGAPLKSYEEAAAEDAKPHVTRGITMGDAREFAQLLHDYYGATIRGEVETQQRLRSSILASAVVAAGGLLFDSHVDLVAGAGLVGGSAYAAGQSVAWSERRKTLDLGMQAAHCLFTAADNTGLTASDVERVAQTYFRTQQAQSVFFENLTRLQGQISRHRSTLDVIADDPGQKVVTRNSARQASGDMGALVAEVEAYGIAKSGQFGTASASYASALHDIEVASRGIVNRTLEIQRRINLELARLEPDLVSFTRNIREALGTGFSAVSGLPLEGKADPAANDTDGRAQTLVVGMLGLGTRKAGDLNGALTKLRQLVATTSGLGLDAQSETTATIANMQTGAQRIDAGLAHFRMLNASGFAIDHTVPANITEGCTLALPERVLRFEPSQKTIKISGDETIFDLKVVGGLTPHQARPLDETKLQFVSSTPIRQNASIIVLKVLAAGETKVAVSDNSDLGAVFDVKIVAADEAPERRSEVSDASCPAACNCDDKNADGLSERLLKGVQSALLAGKHLKDAQGDQITDPVVAIDGKMGPITRGGICAFKTAHSLTPVDGRITGAVQSKIDELFPDGLAGEAYHPYEFTRGINKDSLKEVKVQLNARHGANLSDAQLAAYEFDAATRQAFEGARQALTLAAPEDWRKRDAQGDLPAEQPTVPFSQQLDELLHQKLTE